MLANQAADGPSRRIRRRSSGIKISIATPTPVAPQPSALKMRQTLELLRTQAPWLEVDGEMHGDVALDGKQRAAIMPHSALAGNS